MPATERILGGGRGAWSCLFHLGRGLSSKVAQGGLLAVVSVGK